jgi:hypothetical protein
MKLRFSAERTAADSDAPRHHGRNGLAGGGKRSQALLREQIVEVPRPEAQIEAAEIPERSLIAAADALGVRCRRGEWWLPG